MGYLRDRLLFDRKLRLVFSAIAFLLICAIACVPIVNINFSDVDNYAIGLYEVVEVIDGDTIKVKIGNDLKSVRLIGIDTPETVDSRTDVQCYGEEASAYLKNKLTNKAVELFADKTQDDTDKYDRLLRYASLDGADVGLELVENGYAKEYTYEKAYNKQKQYQEAQEKAKNSKLGLWGEKCIAKEEQKEGKKEETKGDSSAVTDRSKCVIKGNISYYGGKKIYHMPGQKYYDSTTIDTNKGERWFCTEAEAQAAGWRKSKE